MIDRDVLLAKQAQLKSQQEQLVANINAVVGALGLIENLLHEIDDPVKPDKDDTPTT